ncbi:MAG: hypothetical protein ACXVCY_04655 [Pseudobdellovibrionaceae bacterium]
MASRKLIVYENGAQVGVESASETVDFLSVKVGGLELKEVAGQFSVSSKKITELANGTAATDATTVGQLNTGLNLKVDKSDSGAANGFAPLGSDAKIPSQYLPAVAITDTFVVNDEASMLALVAQVGDIAVRTDLSKNFILRLNGASVLSNWQELLSPAAPVQSVNGQTGNVNLSTDNVAEGATNRYYTDARAKDAAGAAVKAGAGIDVSYNSGTKEITVTNKIPMPTLSLVNSYGAVLAQNEIVYLKSDGTVVKAASTTLGIESIDAIGVVKDSSIANLANGLIQLGTGLIDTFTGLTPGATYYLSSTLGALTTVPPTSAGEVVYKIGVALTSTVLKFEPKVVIKIVS